jgi:putative sterol carrier protein
MPIAGKLTPRTFFDDVCPRLLKTRTATDTARFGFTIDGAGAWTIDLAKRAVTPGTAADVDASLAMSSADFSTMLAGELDLLAAIQSGTLRLSGAAQKLALLGDVFANAQG